ncbi:MAG TPA: DNA methyltransferase [Terriglobia bacterium]|nr:DNA methyltransferase [Terriglobia bacterium]
METATTDGYLKILDESYARAHKRLSKPFVTDGKISKRIETVAICLKNRAGVRALLACALAKIDNPKVDIRKPYTDIAGDDGSDSYSGRAYDESYISTLGGKPYNLPLNSTTAFLTPGFRTKNIVLTTSVELEGRPAEMYTAVLQLFDDIQKKRVSAQDVMDETMRLLILERDKRAASIKNLLKDIEHTADKLPLSAEDIVRLVRQHLDCKNSSRLPVLVVAAAYRAAEKHLGERVLHVYPHNAADKQTGAAGDLEIALVGDDHTIAVYEMKMKPVTRGDVDHAVQNKLFLKKSSPGRTIIKHYVFITTEEIDADVRKYATDLYEQLGGVEIAILTCLGFIAHFLHLFHRLRNDFLDEYQNLVLKESESAVSHTLKEALLTLRKAAEGAK